MVFVQGRLTVVVVEARNLPNLDKSKRHPDNLSDPYVTVRLIDQKKKETKIGKTPTIDDCLNPKWFHSFSYDINQEILELRFDVKDEDKYKNDLIGSCSVPAYAFCSEKGYEGLLELFHKKRGKSGSLHIKVKLNTPSSTAQQESLRSPSTRSVKLKGCVPRETVRKSSNPPHLIHGKVLITVHHAENLPNLDMSILDKKNKTDAFVVVYLVDDCGHKAKIAATKTIDNDLNPKWNETFPVDVCHEITEIVFTVYDEDVVTKEKIASVSIPSSALAKSDSIEGIFDLRSKGKKFGRLKISMKFADKKLMSSEVQNCIYPQRVGNLVRLYQDAHCPRLPGFTKDSLGNIYESKNAWVDVQESLKEAKNFILITGWSVKTSIALVRSQNEEGETLGHILYKRACEGVDVRLLLWDEITSTESKQTGAMSTFDNETKQYFKNSSVKVSLALRKKKTKGVIPEGGYFAQCCYSHHQKTIITDAPIPGGNSEDRQIVAFVGGLDLTAGRYDTPDHPLFKTLDAQHKSDFYNNIVSTNSQSGPRQPWHDIHGKIIGPSAQDVMQNFIDRWVIQGQRHDGANLNMNGIKLDHNYVGQDHWNVQVFRSISQDSVPFYRESTQNIISKKGRNYDNSLQRAYIHHIQKAERFIYIENQYFLGSSHLWESCRDIPVKNLIPLEIATKIATKIKRKEQFVAYILIPMFPEGNPEDMAMQEIIHWQFHTIEMMYRMVGNAIQEARLDTEPQDYLLFFCVGKRESADEVPNHLRQPLDETAQLAFRNRRSMIYVHSKMAIFDDDFIIVGSANINDRSLGGTRDTEIAFGAHQPIAGQNGDVGSFRKCLWLEHLGETAPIHMEPGSIQCARKLRELSEDNLQHYINVALPLPKSHLLLYPLRVGTDGSVSARSDCSNYPDTKASTVGMRSKVIPSELTT